MDTCIIGEWKEENYNKKANATIYQKQSQVNYRSIRLCRVRAEQQTHALRANMKSLPKYIL